MANWQPANFGNNREPIVSLLRLHNAMRAVLCFGKVVEGNMGRFNSSLERIAKGLRAGQRAKLSLHPLRL